MLFLRGRATTGATGDMAGRAAGGAAGRAAGGAWGGAPVAAQSREPRGARGALGGLDIDTGMGKHQDADAAAGRGTGATLQAEQPAKLRGPRAQARAFPNKAAIAQQIA
eukprot:5188708-Alexandrium_andersonii.AAC.1